MMKSVRRSCLVKAPRPLAPNELLGSAFYWRTPIFVYVISWLAMVGGILFFFSLESHVDDDDDEYF